MNQSNSRWIYGYNSLRFVAFLLIFLFHSIPKFPYLYGVQFFFVLSSFLLTYLALGEIEKTGSFSAVNFILKRAFRILPLYYLIVTFSFFVLPVIAVSIGYDVSLPSNKNLFWIPLSNFDKEDYIFSLKFLWSIAVEEQFYMLFLLLILFLRRNFYFVLLALIALYIFSQILSEHDVIHLLQPFLRHLPFFITGILTAIVNHTFFKSSRYLILIGLVGLGVCFTQVNDIVFYFCIAIFYAGLLVFVKTYGKNVQNVFMFRVLEELGKYTYGLYVYSGFVITFSFKFLPSLSVYLRTAVSLFLLIIVSYFSYHLFEKQFLNLKRYLK